MAVRGAARGDPEAVAELARRHGPAAWRLAHAVTGDEDLGAAAVAAGFADALWQARRGRARRDRPFAPVLLGAVHAAAMALLAGGAAAPPGAPPGRGGTPSGQALAGAFRHLPERWRTVVWLTEVEGLPATELAPVLGVGARAAATLAKRAGETLRERLDRAGFRPPEALGPLLAPLGGTAPAGLGGAVAARWLRMVHADAAGRLTAGWLGERATRPIAVAAGTVLSLGLIGIGVIGQHAGVAGTGSVALPQVRPGAGVAVAPPARGRQAGGGGGGTFGDGSLNPVLGPAPPVEHVPAAAGPAGPATPSPGSGSGGTGGGSGGSGGSGGTGGGSGGSGGSRGTGGGSGGTTGGSGSGGTTATTLGVPGVAEVGLGGGGASVQLLPGSDGSSLAGVQLGGSCGLSLTLLSGSSSCSSTTSAAPGATTTTTTTGGALGGLLGGLGL